MNKLKPSHPLDITAITVDIDWAPDFMIDQLAARFSQAGVKCTWFVTHASPAVDRLKSNPNFELGIHPNFLPGTSHGSNEDEIIEYCLKLVPDAKSVRTHALVQSSPLLCKLKSTFNIQTDCSLFLPQTPLFVPNTICHAGNASPLVRIPYNWEDDVECLRPKRSWKVDDSVFYFEGMKIFNFHPVYVELNETDFSRYSALKKKISGVMPLNAIDQSTADEFMQPHVEGVLTFLTELLEKIQLQQRTTYTMTEVTELYLNTYEQY